MKNALSINGGGIRGIIPCTVLAALEKQTGKLSRDVFSFVSGTSTGALLAAGIAAGVPCSQLLTVYTTLSQRIFTPTGLLSTARLVADGYRYDPKNIRDVLVQVFGKAASWKMNDCPIGICIPATAANGHNWYFVRDGVRNAKTTGNVMLIDAAVASASAPTYFKPWPVSIQGKTVALFDGGVGGCANPAYQTCVEMFDYDGYVPYCPEEPNSEMHLISLGTGYYPSGDKPPAGLVATIEYATNTLVDNSEDWVDQAVQRQWPGTAQKFDWLLASPIPMNDLSSIPALVAAGKVAAAAMDWDKALGKT